MAGVQTMLETYAAWLEGTTEADLRAIQNGQSPESEPTS
jgi:hypothetical protein